ncbi:hypothetical protein EBR25_12960 [bacterium]|nr:hypothetical protein [bacterium]
MLGLVWGEFPGIFASHMKDLKDCLSLKSFKRGGFLGLGATKTPCWDPNDPGFQLQPECMEGLCECNKDLLKGGGDLKCSWSLEKFNCKTVEKALKKGGAALINIGDRDDKTTTGHTVQAVAVKCDEKGNLSEVIFRDPANPEQTTDATVCQPPCGRWHSEDPRYDNMTAEGFYTIGQTDRP